MMKFSCFELTVENLYKHVVPKPRSECNKAEQLGVTFLAGYIGELALHGFKSYFPCCKSSSFFKIIKKKWWSSKQSIWVFMEYCFIRMELFWKIYILYFLKWK